MFNGLSSMVLFSWIDHQENPDCSQLSASWLYDQQCLYIPFVYTALAWVFASHFGGFNQVTLQALV